MVLSMKKVIEDVDDYSNDSGKESPPSSGEDEESPNGDQGERYDSRDNSV
jgi:hypothetical protein